MKHNKLRLSILSSAIWLTLSGCGSDNTEVTAPQVKDSAPVVNDIIVNDLKQWVPVSTKFNATDADNDLLSFSFSENGTVVTRENGVYTFSHGILESRNFESFQYISVTGEDAVIDFTVSAKGKSASAKIIINNVLTDPLTNQQWHLRNTGQKAYALSDEMKQGLINLYVSDRGYTEEEAKAKFDEEFAEAELDMLVPGQDMNVAKAISLGATGQGMTAVVVDSGLEILHEDLIDNVIPNRSLNLNATVTNRTDPTSTSMKGDHGTSVAGLIAAKGWNGLGGRGVAPDASLIGMNYLGSGKIPQADKIAHGFPGSGISKNENIAVFNRSYGITFPTFIGYSELDEAIESYPNLVLRGGKGALNMKSSGNSFEDGGDEGTLCADNGANELGLTCYNGAFEPSQGHPYYLSVAAVNSNGKHTSYSTAGANLLVSAPSGEYGRWAPAMVTTDQMTCINGYSGFNGGSIAAWSNAYGEEFAASQFPFNFPGHADNATCNYTSTFNGTSSAAPNASGVVALILSANPNLTWRDVRHILVSTSTLIDADNEKVTLSIGDDEFSAHDAWVENAAGFSFNNLYGFGRVDAGAAVAMAKSYNAELGEQVISEWQGQGSVIGEPALTAQIPDNDAKGLSQEFEVTDNMTVEAMQFKFDVSNEDMSFGLPDNTQTTAGVDLAIEVTSPAGTRSVLLSSKQALMYPAYEFGAGFQVGYILKNAVMLSNAFYGENAKGTWKIRLIDTSDKSFASSDAGDNGLGTIGFTNNATPSVLEGVSLRVFGHAGQE